MQPSTGRIFGGQHFSSPLNRESACACSLFEIRLERDVIVFRGGEDEATDQILKGAVVLCLKSPLRVETIQLCFGGTLRQSWTSDPGIAHSNAILMHKWPPFVRADDKNTTLPAGNYEWPFEYVIPSGTAETVEGMPEASIIYSLEATMNRSKLVRQQHARKRVRIIRTLPLTALEFVHTMRIENLWVDKIDYSVTIPTKAIVLGGSTTLDMRFTPLAKGLVLGRIEVTLWELCEFSAQSRHRIYSRDHQVQRTVKRWEFDATDEDWQDCIEETGEEGWVMTRTLDIPRRLCECIQDLEVQGIKVKHKIKVFIPLRNLDGHMSKLDMALPVHVFISPNMPPDEEGNIANHATGLPDLMPGIDVPPEYGEHVLDQVFDHRSGWQHTASQQDSSIQTSSSPRAEPSRRLISATCTQTEHRADSSTSTSQPNAADVAAYISSETIDESIELAELSRVPTYGTAVRSPLRSHVEAGDSLLPDYMTVVAGRENETRC
ncbi:hypothetical protein B0J15DRAFT_502929 [Fusarium solani]|uniref:Arrestin C-terminal-like domain-containing protein n=1 Tax=Fusarium solani TaxID=169388 RepID=A0A9P9GI08_FUSSL|nr:uncharacterized protein B0J15DRAFT_502929 [Fusarium solani]KAH7239884.1 hypothetical protein B0J15DRAFT_502929 [Fusarium solani]